MIAVLMLLAYLLLILMPCLIAENVYLDAEEANAIATLDEGDRV